jgi:hypothetical protein
LKKQQLQGEWRQSRQSRDHVERPRLFKNQIAKKKLLFFCKESSVGTSL